MRKIYIDKKVSDPTPLINFAIKYGYEIVLKG